MRRRNKQIHIYLTEEELTTLDEKVSRTNMSREGYIRTLINNSVPVEMPPIGYADLARELNRIGTNLNQLAAVANSEGFIDKKMYEENYSFVKQICTFLLQALLPRRYVPPKDLEDGYV